MSKPSRKDDDDTTMRDEYDFSQGVRGKYADRVREGTNVVVLDPDVAAEIKTEEAVNRILRAHIKKQHPKASGE